MMPIGALVGIGTNLECESKSVHPVQGVETRQSEESLKSSQVNYVNISITFKFKTPKFSIFDNTV